MVVNYSWSSTEVVVSSLGAEASVKGAAGVTLRRIIDDPAGLFEDVLAEVLTSAGLAPALSSGSVGAVALG